MPRTGTPRSKIASSRCGAPSSYTLDGPPESTMPDGRLAAISAAVTVWGTISEYTLASRTRRAINCAYCAPKSTTSTGPDGLAESAPPSMSVMESALICRLREGQGFSLAAGQVGLHLLGDARLHEEREEGHDAAERDHDELRERPAHQRPQTEVGEEVHDVEPAVCDQDARAQVDARRRHRGRDRHEGEDAVVAEREELVPQTVLDDHLGTQQEQHDARDVGEHLVEPERPADLREVFELGSEGHGSILRSSRRPLPA